MVLIIILVACKCDIKNNPQGASVTDDCEHKGIIFENTPQPIGVTKTVDMGKPGFLKPDYVISYCLQRA